MTASGTPTPTYSIVSGALPTGLSFNTTTGVLSGVPTQGGISSARHWRRQHGGFGDANVDFDRRSGHRPSPAAAQRSLWGLADFPILDAGFPQPSLSESGSLPGGVSFVAGAGALSGTPAAGTSGIYNLIFTAGNNIPRDAPEASR